MSNRIKKSSETKSSFQEKAAFITGIFVIAVLCLLPVVFTDFYFNILETKYIFYCIIAIGTMVLLAGSWLAGGRSSGSLKGISVKEIVKGLSIIDWSMIVFWLCNVFSWIFCWEWRYEAFWGTSGRYNGVFLMTVYMVMYFIVTRFFHFKQWYLDAFLAVGIFVCVFGITDYFQMDILGFKVNMVPEQRGIYVSTFGNINTYTVYVAAVLVVSMILFALDRSGNPKRLLWYYGNMALSSFALIMGSSDNAYLSLAALFGFAPLWLFRTKTGARRYLISVATFFTVIQCVAWINGAYGAQVLGVEGVFSLLARLRILSVMVVVLWIAAAAATLLTRKKAGKTDGGDGDTLGKGLIYGWLAVIVLAAAVILFVLYDANIAGNGDRYGSISSYVVFNDAWGTNRGYVWTRSMDIYMNKFTPLQKIFGYGADTLKLLMSYYFRGRMENGQLIVYDSVHNEYLHYLITIGPIGMLAYISFLVSSVVTMCRRMKDHPEIAAAMFAVAAYMTQATVNINLPIATPVILTLLAMGVGKYTDRKKEAEVK